MNSIIESMIKNSELSKKSSHNSDSMIALEVALPIAFIVVFLIILLLTYFLKEIVIRKKKKKSFAATNRNQHQNSRILNSMDYTQVRKLNNYANVTTSKLNESIQYYEEPRAGFYHVQKINHNYNYEKIYSDKFKRIQSNLIPMPPIQFCNNNKLCKIEETNSYGLPSIHNFEPLNTNETSRFEINLTKNKSKSINLNASQQNKQMKDEKKSEKNHRIRRSYSNSKLDIKKWQSLLAKQKPCLNKSKKWPSKIMTEHELKTFLAQNKKLTIKNNNVSILNSEKDLYRIKKFTTTTTTTSTTTTTTINTFETINPKLTETNIKKVSNRLSLMKALSINLSETKLSLKENTLVKLGQKLKEKTSEKNMLLLKNVKILKEENLNDQNSFSITNKHLKNVKYSRLCKSFTFLSHKLNDSITKKKVINSIKVNSFASDPSKLGSFSSFKTNQNNYLKSMHTFKTKGLSMSSIFEKVSSVANWNKNVNSRINDSNNISNPQTNSLMFSNSSSLNSQLTTLMQTNNNFGSIIASNFGSVNLKNQMGVNSKLKQKSMRQRTYSDGNCLSESGSVLDCKNLNNQNNNKILPNISVHSVSVSKLTFIRNRI